VWHDRAVLHFLTASDAVNPGGHVIVSTFGPEGPTKCGGSMLFAMTPNLHDQFGVRFRLVECAKELHRTPFGTTQQFLFCYCKVE
jgi:hypothetical protein